ncbi:hypothetical protein BDV36DRAFT_281150 [Aspergillus pseudocaelatus]|uniref:tyrosine--tRNA ligase n=1 Tax=Aspergillus pseudocaelatus TaxID=1825620 RepID=A0ABQ6WUZ2_9EURO|nr:hypothetical protein BDV36DRAFT_281150 [Aspergillus pseudocaelatus]
MAAVEGVQEKYALITRRLELQSGFSGQELRTLLLEKKNLRFQWPTAPTGKPHIGYFIPWVKFADFIRAGGEVIVDIVDIYAYLVNYIHSWEEVLHRTTYYRCLVTAALKAMGIPLSRVKLPQSSTYQNSESFSHDLWRILALSTLNDVRETGDELGGTTMLSPLLTPLLQALSEEYYDIDVQFGGKDQRGLFNLNERVMPQLGYRKRIHLLNDILPGLTGAKMSSSHAQHTKIMFLDDPETVKSKLESAVCIEGVAEGNGILGILEHILFPVSEIRQLKLPAVFGCPEGTLLSVRITFNTDGNQDTYRHYKSYKELEEDYVAKKVYPNALKLAVAEGLNALLGAIRREYESNKEWQEADRLGYPEDWLDAPKAEL